MLHVDIVVPNRKERKRCDVVYEHLFVPRTHHQWCIVPGEM